MPGNTSGCVGQVQQSKDEGGAEAEGEERVVSIVSSLMQGLARGSRRDRVAAKFVENEFEKCDRLMELYTRYTRRVRAEEVSLSTPDLHAHLHQPSLALMLPASLLSCPSSKDAAFDAPKPL